MRETYIRCDLCCDLLEDVDYIQLEADPNINRPQKEICYPCALDVAEEISESRIVVAHVKS